MKPFENAKNVICGSIKSGLYLKDIFKLKRNIFLRYINSRKKAENKKKELLVGI